MPLLILLLFIALPIAEIALLIKVSEVISLVPTLLLIVTTAVIGVSLLRQQGLSSLQRAQADLSDGRLPLDAVIDAIALPVAGALLLTPGLITDTLGFALLIPAVRRGIAHYLFDHARNSPNVRIDIFGMNQQRRQPQRPQPDNKEPRRTDNSGPVIEGEAVEIDETEKPNKPGRSSPWNH